MGLSTRTSKAIFDRVARTLTARALADAPPEFFLAAACCRWPPSESRSDAIRAAAKGPVDWAHFLKIVKRHRIWGLVRDGLVQAGVTLPAEFDSVLNAKNAAMARDNLVFASETARLCRLFREAGISTLFVKGVSLALQAYGNFALKHNHDIDILVSPAEARKAREAMERAGYVLVHPLPAMTETQWDLLLQHGRDWEFTRKPGNIVAELHWSLTYNGLLMRDDGSPNSPAAVRIGDTEIPTFGLEDLFVYLCAHGAQHAWFRLKWLADFAALLASVPGAKLEGLYRAAQRKGSGRCAAQGLLLCERLFGLKLPASLSTELRGTATGPLLEALGLDGMLGARGVDVEVKGRAFGMARLMAMFFLIGEGRRYYWRELSRYFVSPQDVAAIALPHRLTWLYFVLRIPLWAGRQLKRRKGSKRP